MLVRKYIQQRLQEYYAQPFDRVVGSLISTNNSGQNSIPFQFLFGEYHWKYVYGQVYRRTKGQWLTPSELFTPYYSQCIARWIIRQVKWKLKHTKSSSVNVEIVELGGGRGTNAICILDYIHKTYPDDIYPSISSYTVIDYSKPLLDYQQVIFGTSIHASKFRNRNLDLYEYASSILEVDASTPVKLSLFSTKPSPSKEIKRITVVLGLELLDNLPHDKIRYSSRTGLVEQAELINGDRTNPQWKEVFVPLSDRLLQKMLQYYPIVPSPHQTQCYWIPTIACGIIHSVLKERPDSILFLADFDSFVNAIPNPAVAASTSMAETPIPAIGDPIVTDMNDVDLSSYLQLSVTATDILFPTNFNALASFLRATPQRTLESHAWSVLSTSRVQKQSEFLQLYGPEQVLATTSWWTGYSPMIHDFLNCSVLTFGVNDPL